MMRHMLDLFAILLMGDGMAKLLSLKTHNRFYKFSWAPKTYNESLNFLSQNQMLNVTLGLSMITAGALLSRRMESKP